MSLHVYPILEQNEVEMQFASKYSGYSDLPYLMWQKEYGTIQKYRAWEREKKKQPTTLQKNSYIYMTTWAALLCSTFWSLYLPSYQKNTDKEILTLLKSMATLLWLRVRFSLAI